MNPVHSFRRGVLSVLSLKVFWSGDFLCEKLHLFLLFLLLAMLLTLSYFLYQTGNEQYKIHIYLTTLSRIWIEPGNNSGYVWVIRSLNWISHESTGYLVAGCAQNDNEPNLIFLHVQGCRKVLLLQSWSFFKLNKGVAFVNRNKLYDSQGTEGNCSTQLL